jgi:hypothetical protein
MLGELKKQHLSAKLFWQGSSAQRTVDMGSKDRLLYLEQTESETREITAMIYKP